MKRGVFFALVAAIAVQFLILAGLYVKAQVPLWSGEPIRVKTIPVDPRSMFRGNYARLNYGFSEIKKSALSAGRQVRQGEVVYVSLKKSPSGLYEFSSASFDKPDEGIFLRGRISNTRPWGNDDSYRVKFGIEAYFAPKKKALQLEKDLREGGVAELMVAPSGQVSLKTVVGEERAGEQGG
ncbi:GDYXXLXY domain-containing protein [Microbulbifer sp. VTAC004]|uniref:GDYXXLXY domain-containing protein n=1 Tax=Microbulbifer sp. VTAC004 TaxID=3243386 RepID=UPI0040393110